MIRSSKVSLKFSNPGKLEALQGFVSEYRKLTQFFVDLLWPLRDGKLPGLLPKEMTSQAQTWLSKRAIQAAGKQASGIVRGAVQKQKQRMFVYKKLLKEGRFKQARRLQWVINQQKISKPSLKMVNPELDSRFVKVDLHPAAKEFEGWLTLSSIGKKIKLELPFKGTSHLTKMLERGQLRPGARLSPRWVSLALEIPDPPKREAGSVLGIDVGVRKVISASNGIQSQDDPHGWNLERIQQRLSRRKKGSKGLGRAQSHRNNYVNWSVNQLNLEGVREVRVEDLKHMRRGKRTGRYLSHWTYSAILGKLGRACEESGVRISRVSPTYTSQRCSGCGWVRKGNRRGDQFRCKSCGFEQDADLNASRNIALGLPAISRRQRLGHANRVGFYWQVPGQESIVPGARGALS